MNLQLPPPNPKDRFLQLPPPNPMDRWVPTTNTQRGCNNILGYMVLGIILMYIISEVVS